MIIIRWKSYENSIFSLSGLWCDLQKFLWPFLIFLRPLMPKNSSGMQKSYFWTEFLHKKLTNQKCHWESLCTVWSCEKWQAISWPMVGSPPLLRLTFSEVCTFSKDKNLYRNRAQLQWEVDCDFRICIEIYETACHNL